MKKAPKSIGFIGCGNMANAIISGLVSSNFLPAEHVYASDTSVSALEEAAKKYGISVCENNTELIDKADIIVLAVKPNVYDAIMAEIKSANPKGKIFVSIAAGKTIEYLERGLGKSQKILRTMPNTPALVGEGITAICPNGNIKEDELKYLKELLSTFGIVEVIAEKLFDAVIITASSSPAYVFMFIEAMADAAVLEGMPRKQAYTFAAKAVMGSAKLMLETGKHPGELKDMVCSPGGTTIEAVRVLEERGMRSAVIEAMLACADKCRRL